MAYFFGFKKVKFSEFCTIVRTRYPARYRKDLRKMLDLFEHHYSEFNIPLKGWST